MRIGNIPMNFYTIETMDMLGSAIGKVEEIAYNPEVSQTKDFVRARITLDIANPTREAKKLNLPTGETVVIYYEYEKLRKRCFYCLRLTHEKVICPLLKKNLSTTKSSTYLREKREGSSQKGTLIRKELNSKVLEGPPGFPPMFPELSKQDQQMAL